MGNGANATRAAIAAGYSPRSAAEIGYENLRKPHIAGAIARLAAHHVFTAQACICRLGEIALRSDMADFDPFLTGKKTLAQLQADGVNTKFVKVVRLTRKTTRTTDGRKITTENRAIELYDAQAAAVAGSKCRSGLVTKVS